MCRGNGAEGAGGRQHGAALSPRLQGTAEGSSARRSRAHTRPRGRASGAQVGSGAQNSGALAGFLLPSRPKVTLPSCSGHSIPSNLRQSSSQSSPIISSTSSLGASSSTRFPWQSSEVAEAQSSQVMQKQF